MIPLLEPVIDIALSAGREILDVYDSSDIELEAKVDNSPLTLADRRAHELIVQRLGEEFPDIPILSEEGKQISYEVRSTWERFWLVDPLDGTKEFVKRNGEFTVNIAFIEKERPILGVVHIPAKDTIYFGDAENGAYRSINIGKKKAQDIIPGAERLPLQITTDTGDRTIVRVVASRSHFSEETKKFIEEIEKKSRVEIINAGSALKFCAVAEGSADVYPRFGPTMEWDTAAGQAIAEASGCVVKQVGTDQPLSYNKEALVNPWFIVDR